MREANAGNAIVIGASSGIGRELARVLSEHGYAVGIAARRIELLSELQRQLPGPSFIRKIDVSQTDEAMASLRTLIAEMGGVGLIVVNAGVGLRNPELDWYPEKATIDVNVTGFTAMVNVAVKYFLERGAGHLVGVSSVAAILGHGEVPAYGASKAYESSYLCSLRNKIDKLHKPITITTIEPGFVQTDMVKDRMVFWCAPPRKAAMQIFRAIVRRRRHAYVTRRWRLVAWIMKVMPERLWSRIA